MIDRLGGCCSACRLPRLDGLSLTLNGDLRQLLACTMLYSIRVQLSGLRSLALNIAPSESWIEAEDVHAELGEVTQLTRLCLNLNNMSVSTLDSDWPSSPVCCVSFRPLATGQHCTFNITRSDARSMCYAHMTLHTHVQEIQSAEGCHLQGIWDRSLMMGHLVNILSQLARHAHFLPCLLHVCFTGPVSLA